MTRLMEKVIEQLRSVPEGQQDGLAEFFLHELAEDERWSQTTQRHADKIKGLVDEVLKDDAAGKCEPLDPDRL